MDEPPGISEDTDVITSRNALVLDGRFVYREFYRVLRPGGRSWYMTPTGICNFTIEILRKVREHEWGIWAYGQEFKVCSDDERYFIAKPLSNIYRPEWDVKTLKEIGYRSVETVEDVGAAVYQDWEKKIYQESPLFEICAVK
ncbi:MAG: hypothetical protein ACLSEX_07760 [Blautia sp.]